MNEEAAGRRTEACYTLKRVTAMLHRRGGRAKRGAARVAHGSGSISTASLSSAGISAPFFVNPESRKRIKEETLVFGAFLGLTGDFLIQ